MNSRMSGAHLLTIQVCSCRFLDSLDHPYPRLAKDPTAPGPNLWTVRWQGTLLSIATTLIVAAANLWAT